MNCGWTRRKSAGKRSCSSPTSSNRTPVQVHINTHPLVVRGAAEAFRRFGASRVLVAEGPGHSRDTQLVLEESGMGEVLIEDRIPFVDLNYDAGYTVPNAGRWTDLAALTLPATLRRADWIVSLPKMKTHHWAGVTLSMKNLFGVMPGIYYGWPKNVLHWKGIERCILDINATVRPHFAIVDGIVGMEGDGPIMGTPRKAGVLVMGRNLPAVDATSARIMGIDPSEGGLPCGGLGEDGTHPRISHPAEGGVHRFGENRLRADGKYPRATRVAVVVAGDRMSFLFRHARNHRHR